MVLEGASKRGIDGIISLLALERDSRGLLVVPYAGALALALERGGNGEGEEAVQGMLLDRDICTTWLLVLKDRLPLGGCFLFGDTGADSGAIDEKNSASC